MIDLYRRISRHRVHKIRRGLARGLKRRGGITWLPQLSALTKEQALLAGLELRGRTIYDIGGFEGLLTLFFARSAGPDGSVVTFEPNPDNFKRIVENVALNGFGNVNVRPIGIGRRKEKLALVFSPARRGTGSLDQSIQSKLIKDPDARTVMIEVDTLDSQIASANLPQPDFVKIDVEGLEYDVLLGMKETIDARKPVLLLEIHGADVQRKTENVQRVVELLSTSGYAIRHVESDETIDAANAHVAREGHLYCA